VPRMGVRLDGAVDDGGAIVLESDMLPDTPPAEDVPPLEHPRTAPAAMSIRVVAVDGRSWPKLAGLIEIVVERMLHLAVYGICRPRIRA
jgi:hypothetical protein